MEKSFKSATYGDLVKVEQKTYLNSTAIAVILILPEDPEDPDYGEEELVLSVNLPDCVLEPGEFGVKIWSENEIIAREALASGLFMDTGKRIRTGYVTAPVWKFAK